MGMVRAPPSSFIGGGRMPRAKRLGGFARNADANYIKSFNICILPNSSCTADGDKDFAIFSVTAASPCAPRQKLVRLAARRP